MSHKLLACVIFALTCSGASVAQQSPGDGIYLTAKDIGATFDLALMETGAGMKQYFDMPQLTRKFSPGTGIGFLVEVPDGEVSVQIRIVKNGRESSVSSQGRHVAGHVVNDEPQIAAFK